MTDITKLVAEIKAKAEKANGDGWHSSSQEGGKGHCNLAQVWGSDGKSVAAVDSTEDRSVASARAAHIARMDPPTTLLLIAAYEEAVRERDELRTVLDDYRRSWDAACRANLSAVATIKETSHG